MHLGEVTEGNQVAKFVRAPVARGQSPPGQRHSRHPCRCSRGLVGSLEDNFASRYPARVGSQGWVNTMRESIDLREAINAVSDVVMNRPRPIRVFDQIYMKTGDMVLQSEFIASWADGRRLAFMGDSDAISVCAAYLQKREVIDYGPSRITVFDFDERIVGAVNRFADKERLENLDAVLYNCIDALPAEALGKYDMFYTNPPWGQHNAGTSVNVFAQRGMRNDHQPWINSRRSSPGSI